MTISAAQCRAARALLDWTQEQLAQNAQVARATIADFERNIRMLPMRQNLVSIVSTLEVAGIQFVAENDSGEGVGVRFRRLQLEYSTTVRPDHDNIIISVRYKGMPFAVTIPRAIIEDIDHASSLTTAESVKMVQNHLPKFLRATEEKLIRGKVSNNGRIILAHKDFPNGTFR